MKVITTREIARQTKAMFDLAETERVSIKRGKKYVNLIVSNDPAKKYVDEDWVAEFMAIPAEYRVNPFEISPSGDLFWADRRNVEELSKRVSEFESGTATLSTTLKSKEDIKNFLDSI